MRASTLIEATKQILQMTENSTRTLLLEILETNPKAVIKHLSISEAVSCPAMDPHSVQLEDIPPGVPYCSMGPAIGTATFNVEVAVPILLVNKIKLIRLFREITGASLIDAKKWTEGIPFQGCPSGKFAYKITKSEALDYMNAIGENKFYKTACIPLHITNQWGNPVNF